MSPNYSIGLIAKISHKYKIINMDDHRMGKVENKIF